MTEETEMNRWVLWKKRNRKASTDMPQRLREGSLKDLGAGQYLGVTIQAKCWLGAVIGFLSGLFALGLANLPRNFAFRELAAPKLRFSSRNADSRRDFGFFRRLWAIPYVFCRENKPHFCADTGFGTGFVPGNCLCIRSLPRNSHVLGAGAAIREAARQEYVIIQL